MIYYNPDKLRYALYSLATGEYSMGSNGRNEIEEVFFAVISRAENCY